MSEIKEQLISFNTARLAHKKGFNIGVTKNWYTRTGKLNSYSSKSPYYVVTQSLLQKWLRDAHSIHITINKVTNNGVEDGYTYKGNPWDKEKTYEEALEKGLQEALKLIK